MATRTMNMKEFVETFCQDILEESKLHEEALPEITFTYDYKVPLEDGGEEKVINAGGYEIYIVDILTLSENDFKKAYPGEDALEAYKNYLSNFVILEGEEVLEVVRNNILKASRRITKFSELNVEDLDCRF